MTSKGMASSSMAAANASGFGFARRACHGRLRRLDRPCAFYEEEATNAQQRRHDGTTEETRRRAVARMVAASVAAIAPDTLAAMQARADESKGVSALAQRRKELALVKDKLAKDPEDALLLSERYYLESEVGKIESNAAFLASTRSAVQKGESRFMQHAVLEVRDLDKAVLFWTQGLGMSVNRARGEGSSRQAFVSYGPESLKYGGGGKFALELIENPSATGETNGNQFFQVALPSSLRVNRLYASGGEITFGYGYFEIDAPEGYKVKAYIENRRDPFDLIGVYVDDVDKAAAYYASAFGMTADRKYADSSIDNFEPKRPKGSVLMTYGSPKDNASILLIPGKGRPSGIKIAVLDRDVFAREKELESKGVSPAFVGPVPGIGTKVALVKPEMGVPLVFVDYEDFEGEQPLEAVRPVSEEIERLVAQAKED